MRIPPPLYLLVALGAAVWLPACAQAPGEETTDGGSPFDMSEEERTAMEAEAMALGMPSDAHAELATEVGSWDVAVRFRGPDGEWAEATGSATKTLDFGGRYLVEEFSMVMAPGMAFSGRLVQTYDNYAQRYTSFWYDDMSTEPLLMYGQKDADGRLVYETNIVGAWSPNGRLFKHASQLQEDGTIHVQMFDTYPGDEEMMNMEMVYTRSGGHPDMSEEAAMALMMQQMELSAPGEEMAEMAHSVGEWTVEMKYRMDPTSEEWQSSFGTSKIQSTLGGRLLVEKYTVPMDPMGEAEAVLLLGYDRLADEYYSIHMSNWSTVPTMAKGKRGEDGVIHMHGQMIDTVSPAGRPMRVSSDDRDPNRVVVKVYDTIPPHGEVQVVEMIYTRPEGGND